MDPTDQEDDLMVAFVLVATTILVSGILLSIAGYLFDILPSLMGL